MYLPLWTNIRQASGGCTAEQAAVAAGSVLPDILRCDHTQPAACPTDAPSTNGVSAPAWPS
jgi:hypothetical protein